MFPAAGVLFDNDGVLVDSHEVAAGVWNQWATRWVPGFDFHRDIRHGLRLREVVADLVSAEHAAAATEDLMDMELTLATDVPPIRGAAELIAGCPPGSWALVTSGRRCLALARLTSAGIAHPVSVVSADDVASGKPAPDRIWPAQPRSACAQTSASCSKTRPRAFAPHELLALRTSSGSV